MGLPEASVTWFPWKTPAMMGMAAETMDALRWALLGMTGLFLLMLIAAVALRRYFRQQAQSLADARTRLDEDIIERERAERAVHENLAHLLALIENLHVGVLAEDDSRHVIYANHTLREMLAPQFEQLTVGASCLGIAQQVRALFEYPDAFVQAIARWADDGVAVLGEEFALKDGRILALDYAPIWMDEARPERDRRKRDHLYLFRDITEHVRAEQALRESERRYRLLAENVTDVIWTADLDTCLTYLSPSCRRLVGYEPGELLGQTFKSVLPPSSQEVAEKGLADALAMVSAGQRDPHAALMLELEMRHKDGHTVWTEVNAVLLCREDGLPTGILGVSRDIGERRTLEERLRVAQRMESIGRLAGGIAHDFNNLLTVINGYGQMLIGELAADDPRREEAKEICRAGERAADLTRQLLAFSRRQMLYPLVLNLNEILAGLQPMLRRLIGEDITLSLRLDSDLAPLKADPTQVEQVIMNLVINARDAMPTGGTLTLSTTNVTLNEQDAHTHAGMPSGRYVLLVVSDTGVGMTDEVLEHLYEPFFTTKGKGQGTGLGLATVYGIVKQSNGYIFCHSAAGHGTTFEIYLPQVDTLVTQRPGGPPESMLRRGSETVLLAEDDDAVRGLAVETLARQGYTVLAAGSGAEALEICQSYAGPIHLLLTDVIMPQMSGNDLAQRAGALRPDMRVLYMSGYTNGTMVTHGVLAAGVHLLQKPFAPNDLARKVRQVLESGRDGTASSLS